MTAREETPTIAGNVIPFVTRSEMSMKNAIHDNDCSANAGSLDFSFTETTEKVLPAPSGYNTTVRQDRVDSLKQRLRAGLWKMDAEQVARSMLKRHLLAERFGSRRAVRSDVPCSQNSVTDKAS